MVEVGVLQGNFAHYLIETCSPKLLYLVDLWAEQPREVYADYRPGYINQHTMDVVKAKLADQIEAGSVKLLRGMSVDMAGKIPDGSCDFIYIDADHSYAGCLADIKAYWPKLKDGGIMAGHDYDDIEWSKAKGKAFKRTDWGVVSAVNEFFPDGVNLIELPSKNWWVKK